jgi:hypothetical protein
VPASSKLTRNETNVKLNAMAGAIFALAALAPPCFALSESERIDAVSEFLLDRAKANYLYIFGQQIAQNKTVRCYFPTIYSYVSDGDMTLLLKGRTIWSDSIEADLKTLVARSAAKALNRAVDFRKTALTATDRYIEISQYLVIRHNGVDYRLDVMPVPRPAPDVVDLLNGFFLVGDLRDTLLRIGEGLQPNDSVCDMPAVSLDDLRRFASDLKAATTKLEAWKKHIDAHMGELTVDRKKLDDDCKSNPARTICTVREQLLQTMVQSVTTDMNSSAATALGTVATLTSYADQIAAAKGNTAKVIVAIGQLKRSGAVDDDQVIETFKRHILFFAELADSDSPAQVKEILEEYTLPPVSFAAKREKYKNHVLVSSYLGVAYGKATHSPTAANNNDGVYAPIGVEASRGLRGGGSLSLMLAPVDFGYPISLKLNGVTSAVKMSDVVAPSVALTYGIAKYPVSVGIAYQKGRRDDLTGKVETRTLLFVSFDLPLLSLF